MPPTYPVSTAAETTVGSSPGQHKPLQTQVSVGDEAIKMSLQSAVEEKLQRKLNETFDRYQVNSCDILISILFIDICFLRYI